jgi:transposase-like protein
VIFPLNILDFQQRFSSENACWQYLRRVRWPDGFRCPHDGTKAVNFIRSVRLWECEKGHRISVTAETVMHQSHIPLKKWFWAAYLASTQKTGLSALNLAAQIGVSYETAYMMLQRLRAGMVCPQGSKIRGVVEMDETYVNAGRLRKVRIGGRGRGSVESLVIAAVQTKGEGSQLRIRRISTHSGELIERFALDCVEQGSTIITDGLPSYSGLSELGFRHVVRRGADSKAVAKELPHIHHIFSNLKGWLIGTHHGVSQKHLQAYLNEFAFRYNHRNNPFRAFGVVLGLGSAQWGPQYEDVYNADRKGGWHHAETRQCSA